MAFEFTRTMDWTPSTKEVSESCQRLVNLACAFSAPAFCDALDPFGKKPLAFLHVLFDRLKRIAGNLLGARNDFLGLLPILTSGRLRP